MENEDLSSPAPVQTVTPAQAPVTAPVPAPFDPRRRIRELLSVPERDRTDAEWDELNELEIQTAPGNRASNQQQPSGYTTPAKPGFNPKNRMRGKGKPGGSGGPGGRPQGNRPHNPNNNPNKPRPA